MSTIDDAVFIAELCAALTTGAGKPVYPYEVPAAVGAAVCPYALAYPVGGQWDRGLLERGHSAGWYGVQFTSVGKGVDKDGKADYLWLAGKIRAACEAALSGTGWTVSDAESEGPPLPVDSAGTLTAVAERIRFYVQKV